MKKHFFTLLLCGLLAVPSIGIQADTVVEGQSTEGKDFWVTFMQADQKTSKDAPLSYNGSKYNAMVLSLSISAREACQVTIENPFTGYKETVDVEANKMKEVELFNGLPVSEPAREAMAATGKVCYAVHSEQADTCALHVTATKNVSLFATNYKKATFDATNVLPTPSLLKEYVIQSYTPSDHDGTAQGTHFAIIATENNTQVVYTPSIITAKNAEYSEYLRYAERFWENDPWVSEAQKKTYEETLAELEAKWGDFVIGEHSDTVMLNKGQVYYVWSGNGEGDDYDLSGTVVKANKNIAVFQGSPHLNIPYQIKQRDHIFSQAMPTDYWGNTFVLTASASRPADIIRIMALNDGTEVRINGELVHTFDFATEKKHFWEFEIGTNGTYAKDGSCVVNTSCPCAVHLFIVSQQYHGDKNSNGDPAMLWINPIEQQIDQVTFATYKSSNGTTNHYVNIVTDQPSLMRLDDKAFAEGDFKKVNGSDTYYYAQKSLGNEAESHTLKSEGSNFIAHVYGFTENESYGYSAGGATKPLTQYITINGEIFTPDTENTLCGEDTIKFACHPDYEYQKIEWHFGDGTGKTISKAEADAGDSIVPHYYKDGGVYAAYVLIYRESSNVCEGQNAVDSIPITVTIGRYHFGIRETEIPCPEDGGTANIGKVYYTNEGKVNLKGNNVILEFDDEAIAAGFSNDQLIIYDDYFQITIPEDAPSGSSYSIHLQIISDCGGTDTSMVFTLPFSNDVIDQRYDNVLGLKNDPHFENYILSDFQWYRKSDSTKVAGQVSANLNFYDLQQSEFEDDAYYVCFTLTNKETKATSTTCACSKKFTGSTTKPQFETDPDSLSISATYSLQAGDKVFVNADWNGETNISCYAQWINASGHIYEGLKFEIPDGGCTIDTPKETGLYLLRVTTGRGSRSFKFIIQ